MFGFSTGVKQSVADRVLFFLILSPQMENEIVVQRVVKRFYGGQLGLRPEQPPPLYWILGGGCLGLRPGWPPPPSWKKKLQHVHQGGHSGLRLEAPRFCIKSAGVAEGGGAFRPLTPAKFKTGFSSIYATPQQNQTRIILTHFASLFFCVEIVRVSSACSWHRENLSF